MIGNIKSDNTGCFKNKEQIYSYYNGQTLFNDYI